MFCRLNDDFILRGYHGATCMLIKRSSDWYRTLEPREFRVLVLCDGTTPLDIDALLPDEQVELQKMQERGVVTALSEPQSLADDQLYRRYDNRFVHAIMWSLTGRCNFKCRHCFLDSPDSDWHELTTEEAFAVVDQMADCGVTSVHLTGGEPFVRRDFWQIIDRLCEKRINVSCVYSNAWLMNDSVLDEFERRGLKPEFSISFDGLGWHDWMRGVPGAEKHALEVMETCVKRGFIVNAAITLHKGNAGVLRETLMKLAEIGVQKAKIGDVQPTDLWLANHDGNLLASEAYFETILNYIPQYYADGMPMYVHLGNAAILTRDPKGFRVTADRHPDDPATLNCHVCSSARTAGYIAPDGRLLPCLPMTACSEQELFPKIQDIGLKQALTDSFYMQFIDSRVKDLLAANPECNACEHKYKCGGGCRASALLSTHELMGCDRAQCFLYQNDYPARIRKTIEDAIAKYCPAAE